MILITGAARGIGRYLFEQFIKESEERVVGTFFKVKPENHRGDYLRLDTSSYSDVQSSISAIKEDLVDITLINCASINYNALTYKSDPEEWKQVINTNVIGGYNIIRELLPIMRNQNFGRIINFSSVVAQRPTAGTSAYAASKSALWGLAKSIAIENATNNITINNINLGYSSIGMIQDVPEKALKTIIEQIPVGRLCEPLDILKTVKYLKTTGYITGASIDLNGGLI